MTPRLTRGLLIAVVLAVVVGSLSLETPRSALGGLVRAGAKLVLYPLICRDTVQQQAVSPDQRHIVLDLHVACGGAAGDGFIQVVVQRTSDTLGLEQTPILRSEGLRALRVSWLDATTILVEYKGVVFPSQYAGWDGVTWVIREMD